MKKPEVVVTVSEFGQSSLHHPHLSYCLLAFSLVPHQNLFPCATQCEIDFPPALTHGKIHCLPFVVLHLSKGNLLSKNWKIEKCNDLTSIISKYLSV